MNDEYFSAEQIAVAIRPELDVSDIKAMKSAIRSVQIMAQNSPEDWPYIEEPCRGGKRKKYGPLSQLSEDIRSALMGQKCSSELSTALVAVSGALPAQREAFSMMDPSGLSVQEINCCMAKASLVKFYRNARKSAPQWGGRVKAREDFVAAYNLGVGGPYPELFDLIGKVAWKTLENWHLLLKRNNENALVLSDTRGKHRAGKRSFTQEQIDTIKSIAYHPHKFNHAEIIRLSRTTMDERGIPSDRSDSTFRNAIEEIKKYQFDEWCYFREGRKSLIENCIPHVERDWDLIRVGDVVFCDGHIWNFETINPWRGKKNRMNLFTWFDGKSNYPLGFDIAASENTESICLALHRGILVLRKMPSVAHPDNGRAIRGHAFNGGKGVHGVLLPGLFETLGIRVQYSKPYHGQSKAGQERWHRTLSEFERKVPSFVGTGIEDKPAHLLRGEKFHRSLHQHLTGGNVPTLIDVYNAFKKWLLEDYIMRPQEGHLNGKCPHEVFEAERGTGLSEEEQEKIKLLLMKTEVRKIGRDGIKLPFSDTKYYHEALYGRQRQSAIVRFDWQDWSKIFVYDEKNRFICTAEPRQKTHPSARHLGTVEDAEVLASEMELQGRLEKKTVGPSKEFLRLHVVPQAQRHKVASGFGDGEKPVLSVPKAVQQLPSEVKEPEIVLDDEMRALIRKDVEDGELATRAKSFYEESLDDPASVIDGMWESLSEEDFWDLVMSQPEIEKYKAIRKIDFLGIMPLAAEAEDFMFVYELSAKGKKHKEHIDNLTAKWAVETSGGDWMDCHPSNL